MGAHLFTLLNMQCSPGSTQNAGAAPVEPLVYLPESASAGKAAKLAALGARLVRVGGDAVEAEVAARAEAERLGATYISPYNDPVVSPPKHYFMCCRVL